MSAAQSRLTEFESDDSPDLSVLSDAEREVYEEIERGDYGPREYARRTNRSPGTVGNLLSRARRKLDEEGAA